MGALSTIASWSPEDDLLLKNAVEAGASLESLAKGAVRFSQKYCLKEIQDRWHSLLYDPNVSTEAAVCVSKFELSAHPLPSKFFMFGHSKERKIVSVKRKADSVRNSYYAMRKRTCNDMLTSMDFNFIVDQGNSNYIVNGSGSLLGGDCIPDGAIPNHFSNLDPQQYGFPEDMMDCDISINGVTAFYAGVDGTAEENFPIEPTNLLREEPLEGNVPLNDAVVEVGVPTEFALDNLIGDDNLEGISLSPFDQINGDPGNLCSEFDENHIFDSPELECGSSFDALQLPPLPDLPIWRTDEDVQEPGVPCDGLNDSISVARGDPYLLAELSDSLLNFTGEEEMFLMDTDGKNGIDKSYYDGLSSLLLNSPIEVSPDQIPGKAETELSVASDAQATDLPVSCCEEVDDNAGLQSNGVQVVHKIEFQMPSSASAKDPQFPELVNGVIFCAFNTEDPEVPSNDDVFLPFDVPPPTFPFSTKSTPKRSNKPIPASVHDYGYRASESGKILMQVERKNYVESRASSQMTDSCGLPGPVCSLKIRRELPNSHASHIMSRSAVIVSDGLGGNNKAAKTTNALLYENSKKVPNNVGLATHLNNNVISSSTEKPALSSNDFRNHLQPNGSSRKKEQDVALPLEDHRLQHAEMGSSNILESELVVNPPTLDEEGQYIESDDDVPYYSDIEAMVLDMDLNPDNQDLCYNEVSRYQHEETKQAIIRLEQGAHSCMQRAMALHGACAILYGRHSKHYIKKPEVLLGRATDSVPVDIDLSKGGYATTISRRQAIIKMDKEGLFYMKNVGKCSILVNNKELHTGQSQRLHSNYLIELRDMAFVFEINQSRVKRSRIG